MKSKLLFALTIVSFGLFNTACEEITFDFDTKFQNTTQISIEDSKKSTSNLSTYLFSESDSINLENNEEVMKHINDIQKLNINQTNCILSGIPEGQEISSLTFQVSEIDLSITMDKISANDSIIPLIIPSDKLTEIEKLLLNKHLVNYNFSGNSTYAPMILSIKIGFESTISVAALAE